MRKSIKLKDPKDWKIAAKTLKRFDTDDKLTAVKRSFAIDLKCPGMLLNHQPQTNHPNTPTHTPPPPHPQSPHPARPSRDARCSAQAQELRRE